MKNLFASQFKKPHGILGIFVSNLMMSMNSFVYKAIATHADFREHMKVLEIGYGPGAGINYLISHFDINIEGIDFSSLMYRRATNRNRKHIRNGKLLLINDDFAHHQFDQRKFDRVIFANVSYFWPDLDPMFSKIHALLSSDGKLVFFMSDQKAFKKVPLASDSVFTKHAIADVITSLKNSGLGYVSTHNVKDNSGNYLVVVASVQPH